MSDTTLIAWTDHTANFWIGCCKVSDGCKNCYAETLTKNRMGLNVWGPSSRTVRKPVKGIYANTKSWNRLAIKTPGVLGPGKPHLVFVGSLMDWAEEHPEAERVRPMMWQTIRENQNLHFQMLTKRAHRIRDLLPDDWGDGYPNVWLGTSIESATAIDAFTRRPVSERADHLRQIPAAVRFISYEPALGPLTNLDLTGIDWIIYGGESGPGWRPEGTKDDPKCWAREIRDRCKANGIAFFHKQSAAHRTEMGIELDGKVVRNYPEPRILRKRTTTLFA